MKIKKIRISLLIFVLCLFYSVSVFASSDNLNLSAKAAILIDTRTNKVLYNKNANEKMYPASTTKIVTAILTLENCNLNDKVTASYNATMSIPDGYTTANIQVGEEFTVQQLLQMLLVSSANDATNVLAEHIGGSIDSFVSMMNTKVHDLGLNNTHFTNAYGLHDENHYTTAYDLAKIMQYCLKNPEFRKIAGSASCAIPATNKSNPRRYTSTNELLIPNGPFYYPYLTAGKTGFTSYAGECLVSSSYKNNIELIGVVLGSEGNKNNRFAETKTLFEFGYQNYELKTIAHQNDVATTIEVKNGSNDTKNLDLLVNEEVVALINKTETNAEIKPEITLNKNVSAPISEGALIGKVTYNSNGVSYTTDLIAAHTVKSIQLYSYAFYIVFGIIALLATYFIFFSKKSKKIIKEDI